MLSRTRLLILTQKVDRADPVLGFFHRWIEAFAHYYPSVMVVALECGEYHLPGNVSVFSLGKSIRDQPASGLEKFFFQLRYALRFLLLAWRLRGQYDAVFVHMNPEYVLVGGLLWRVLRKKIALWYNHTFAPFTARVGGMLAHMTFFTSPYSASAGWKNASRMPAGIDSIFFRRDASVVRVPNSVLCLGRISPVKRVDVLLEAMFLLKQNGIHAELSVVGSIPERDYDYGRRLKERAAALTAPGKVIFYGPVRHEATRRMYNSHEVYVNLTPCGNFDKTVLEAMATETTVLVSSEAFADLLPDSCRFVEGDSFDLARKLQALLKIPREEREALGRKLRRSVQEHHSLDTLSARLAEVL